ncbi:hypothetical protein Clacol_004820 [Clathrus columnatus]|uniref:WD40 repeat-like protein n=1 Tax=Clathrus columnatus TaxID=1419009 RepID=A0AAV5AAU2_9AGAM|nr:hypothetical protein Clacol_004820 [Clathrus columnatus]
MLQTNLIQNAHADLICDASYNFYGTRLATGGLDQRIKVWRLDEQSGEWSVEDEWKKRAHDAAISRLAWAHPQHGQLLASASFDRTVKIWERVGDVGTNPGSFSGVGSGAGASSDRWVERALLSEAKGSVRCVEWAPTAFGMKIATIASDNHLRIYECLESATATAPGGSGGSSTGLNAAGNPSAATPPDSVLGINMSTPGAPVTTPGPSQPWALTWSLIEDIDVSAMPLFTILPTTGGEPASPAPGQSVPLATTTGLGGSEFTTVSGFDTTASVSATATTSGGAGSSSPFIGGKQVLGSTATTLTSTNAGSGSNIAALGNSSFGLSSQGGSGIPSVVAPTGGSPGNTVNSSFGVLLGSPPTTSAFGGLGGVTGLGNVPPVSGSSSGTVHTSKVGNSTVSNREADGGWDLSWCKDPYWGEVCAAVAGGSGIIKIIQLQAGQRPRGVLFLDPRPSSSGSGETLNSRGATPTSTPHLRAQQPGSQFLSPHHPTSAAAAAANHSKPASPKPSSLATTSISWAPSCGRSYHLIAAGSRDGKVRIWKVRPPPPKILDGEDEDETDADADEYEDEQRYGGGGGPNNNNKTSWSASIVADFEDHASAVGKVAWNITGTVLTSAGNDGRVRLWKCTYGNVWRPMGSLDVIQSDDVIDGDRMEE